MRAAIVDRYGPPSVVRVAEVPEPAPEADSTVVRVTATPVTVADARIRGSRFPRGFTPLARLAFGVRRPRRRILGGGFAGVVEAVGDRVRDVAVGDAVCGTTGVRFGAHAELVRVPASRLVPVPAGVPHVDAAAVLFGGITALHFLRDRAGLDGRAGASVLVIGAAGSVGTAAVQLAGHLGGTATGVCSARNADLVRDLGAVRVLDRATVDLDRVDERFDVVLDAVGALPLRTTRRLVAPGGTLLLVAAPLGQTLRAVGPIKAGPAPERPEDARLLLRLVADGTLRVVLDGVLDLEDAAEAHARVDSGRKVGNLVLVPDRSVL